MKNSQFTIALMAVIILVAILTNPKLQDHQQAVKEKFKASFNKSMEENSNNEEYDLGEFGKTLGNMFGNVLIDKLTEQIITIDNYLVFSITKATWKTDTKIIGIGVFGNVFISSEVDKKLNEGLLDNNY